MKVNKAFVSIFAAFLMSLAIPVHAQNVVTEWNSIASTTIVKNGGKTPASASVWFAYASIAAYDAVNAIEHRGDPFYFHGSAAQNASKEAAVLAAEHRILVNYFPMQQTMLDLDYTVSLAAIPGTPSARAEGVAVGERAAAAVIAARAGDGLEANVVYTPGTGPGVWQPTPPKFLAAATPWLAQLRPFTLNSPSQFLPPGPTPLDSDEWERDYNLTRLFGDVSSTIRTPEQTEIGLFWTEHTAQQYTRTFNYLAISQKLDVAESTRLMALLWTGYADAAIGCFNAKYTYNFWRPVTAIPVGGGNSELPTDLQWTPLGVTPNHPEYPAAHACITNTVANLIAAYFGTKKVKIVVDSLAFGAAGVHTHVFQNTDDLFNEVFWARIYAGFHFYHSLVDGGELGERVSRHVVRKQFHDLYDRYDHDGNEDRSDASW